MAPADGRLRAAAEERGRGGRSLTKGGKIMTGVGIGLLAAGAVAIAKGDDTDDSEGVHIQWRKTGYIWVSAGAVLTVLGLTRRE
jgi:hypothetical protein